MSSPEIVKDIKDGTLTYVLTERFDISTAPMLEKDLKASLNGITTLFFDLSQIDTISSSDLRILLNAQQTMNNRGVMRLLHVNENIRDMLEVTGYGDRLMIEDPEIFLS